MVLPLWAQHKVKSNYEKYSQVNSKCTPDSLEVDVFLFVIEYPVIELLDSISAAVFVDSGL